MFARWSPGGCEKLKMMSFYRLEAKSVMGNSGLSRYYERREGTNLLKACKNSQPRSAQPTSKMTFPLSS
jgi:hypothetical protein